MKIVIAPDSFKECLSAAEAARFLAEGVGKILPDCETVLAPVADGGEGTLAALVGPERCRRVSVPGPDGDMVSALYGVKDGLGIVEAAQAAGLALAKEPRRAGRATTCGVGRLILECLGSGCKRILLTAGGTATNDGGCGMLQALGAVFYDAEGREFIPAGLTLRDISRVELSGLSEAFTACEFTLAADVRNTLLGREGATYTYGPQKGVLPGDLELMEEGMVHWADVAEAMSGRRVRDMVSSGAAGGLAVPIMAFGRCRVCSGIEAVLSSSGFYSLAKDADLVITGEGRLDAQSLYGKAVSGVAEHCRRNGVPVYAVCGALGCRREELTGLAEIFAVEDLAEDREDSMRNAPRYLAALGSLAAIDLASGRCRDKAAGLR
ncbi:MAG: glycerate kinase [Abditibacteriota bacterium]|nr:glycerate kinase [Abditibacteriota bacterium]